MRLWQQLRKLGFAVLFGTAHNLILYKYYLARLEQALEKNDLLAANRLHTKLRRCDRLIRYGKALSLNQDDVVEALEEFPKLRHDLPSLMLGRYWRDHDGRFRFNTIKEVALGSLYIATVILYIVLFAALALKITILPAALSCKYFVLLILAILLFGPLWLMGFYSLRPQLLYIKHRKQIDQVEEARACNQLF